MLQQTILKSNVVYIRTYQKLQPLLICIHKLHARQIQERRNIYCLYKFIHDILLWCYRYSTSTFEYINITDIKHHTIGYMNILN